MRDAVFWWTGCAAWAGLSVVAVWFAWQVAIGLACAVSWIRWSYTLMTTHGRQPAWRSLPKTFFVRWFEFVGHRTGETTWQGEGGYWRGIGAWKVWPPNAIAQGREPHRGEASPGAMG
jgi:hypothetical protein